VVRHHFARLEGRMTRALATAVGRGDVRATLDPACAAKSLVASALGLMVVGKANPDRAVLTSIVDSAFAGLH
jgi:TetR/AcrR family transcriptional repressor of nem operon